MSTRDDHYSYQQASNEWRAFTLGSSIEQLVKSAGRSPRKASPRTVYHYTNYAGLVGILSGNEIWASNYNFLNDVSEKRYAATQASKALGSIPVDTSEWKKRVMDDLRHALGLGGKLPDYLRTRDLLRLRKYFEIQNSQLYVASFCREPDLLSMWRGYGSPSRGRFCFSLSVGSGVQHGAWTGASVLYRASDQNRRILHGLPKVFEALRNGNRRHPDTLTWTVSVRVAGNCARLVEKALPFIKHPAFEEEKEWRAVRMAPTQWSDLPDDDEDGTQLRNGRLYMTYRPRKDGNSSMLPVRRIWIGPTPDKKVVSKRLEVLLHKLNRTDISISQSKIPFRDW
jgi:hypothetical protein